jgi:hypothetical protein
MTAPLDDAGSGFVTLAGVQRPAGRIERGLTERAYAALE